MTGTTTMAFCTTFCVVSVVTTLNLYKLSVDGRGTIDRNATECGVIERVDKAAPIVGVANGQEITQPEIFLSHATQETAAVRNNFEGMVVSTTLSLCTVDCVRGIALPHDIPREPASCLAELSVLVFLCLLCWHYGVDWSLLVFFFHFFRCCFLCS